MLYWLMIDGLHYSIILMLIVAAGGGLRWTAAEKFILNVVNVYTAPGDHRHMKESADVDVFSPYKPKPRLSSSPPTDLLDAAIGISRKSPGPSSSLMQSPALRGSKLQQLESYETSHHGQALTPSPRKPLSPRESASPRKRLWLSKSSSSDGNSSSTPASHSKTMLVHLCLLYS